MDGFKLVSIELDKWCGASVSYTVPGDDDGVAEIKVKKASPVHPDLTGIFTERIRARVTWLLGFREDDAEMVVPAGASYPNEDEVIYTAYVKGPAGRYKAKTPKVQKNDDDKVTFSLLEVEAREYIVNGKSAQLSIFGE